MRVDCRKARIQAGDHLGGFCDCPGGGGGGGLFQERLCEGGKWWSYPKYGLKVEMKGLLLSKLDLLAGK